MKSDGWTVVFLLFILMQINKQRELAACGELQTVLGSRITYGDDTHRWPWHAAIYHQFNETDSRYQCGGTLASSKYILTAAHCVSAVAEEVLVSLGRQHLNESKDGAPFIKVAEIVAHPHYSPENYANDIAIITLAMDVIFNSYVQPICLWKSDKLDLSEVIGIFGTVVGWGLTEKGETSNVLQEASLPVVPSLMCLFSNRDLFGRFLTGSNFCAGTRNGTSVCTGDSGGSMSFQEDGRFYIRGIVSVGANKLVDQSTNKFMCDSMQYALFTDVAQYLPWIRDITEIAETIVCETVVVCKTIQNLKYACRINLTMIEPEPGCKIFFKVFSIKVIEELHVTSDRLKAVPDLSGAVDQFTKLEKLTLQDFKLVQRSRLAPFRNILQLSLEVTQLDSDNFVDLNKLEELWIENSDLTILPAGIFRNNIEIRTLVLTSNGLNELHPDVFEKLRNVETLWLHSNRLDTLPANIFRNNEKIRSLDVSRNSLKDVHGDLFNALTNLEALDLANNRIESIPTGLFRTNTKLESVDLSNNKIQKIGVDLTTMPQLRYLLLSGNLCVDADFNFNLILESSENIRRDCAN